MDDDDKSVRIAIVIKGAIETLRAFGFTPQECVIAFRAGLFAMEEIARGAGDDAQTGRALR